MTINSEIFTVLDVKEVAIVLAALHGYIERCEECGRTCIEQKKDAERIMNRLANELYDYPNFDHTKKVEENGC